jgi:hypothetical protein
MGRKHTISLCIAASLGVTIIGGVITVDPADTVAGSTGQQLEAKIGDFGRLAELRVPDRGAPVGRHQSSGRRKAGN